MDLTIDDVKDLLFELWLTQRDYSRLRHQLAQQQAGESRTHSHEDAPSEPGAGG